MTTSVTSHAIILDSEQLTDNVQRALLPGKNPIQYGGIEVSYLWTPCESGVSGDYFYCNKIGNSVYVEIGDVKGHGIAAGLTMTALHGVLWGLRQLHIPLPELLNSANRFLNKLSR